MIKREELTYENLVRSLRSTTCPACAGPKKTRMSVCLGCWRSLPKPLRNPLYNLIGEGYEAAMLEALNFLDAEKFHLPEAVSS